jgi:serine/threonine protein kinase/WD40 repeat protein/Flp pilus assembly protein TadD
MNEMHSELDFVAKLADEFLARYRRGERPSLTEYAEKYPELAAQIRDLFPPLMVMEEFGSVEEPRTGPVPGIHLNRADVPQQLGDYRILREIGRGGMGVVYEAVQESLGRHVALKVLPSHGLLSPTHLERFRREARAAAQLHHSNIVPVHGVGEHDGVHYYAMQYIQGQGLDEVLKEVIRLRGKVRSQKTEDSGQKSEDRGQRSEIEYVERSRELCASLAEELLSGHLGEARTCSSGGAPLDKSKDAANRGPEGSPSRPTKDGSTSKTELTAQSEAQYFRSVAQMGVQVAQALDYAHKQGITHRDIKPSNLLLDTRGTVWITDFGLAKAEGSDELTRTGDIVGTLRYMAPERLNGRSDSRSDVYGLGVTLYELLTLRPAFEEPNRPQLIEQITRDDPPRPCGVDRSIPHDLETIILKAIAKEPGRRYSTSGELAEDLSRFLAGEPVRARRIGLGERAIKWVKRRPAVAALLAVSAAAVLVLTIGTLIYTARLGAAIQDARNAEQEKTRQLAVSQVKEAQARRNGGLVGRRFESLEALGKAMEHFRLLGELDEQRTLELRNEVIACLPLADLKPEKKANPGPGWSSPLQFDAALQHYVVSPRPLDSPGRQGELSIRRLADDQEIARLPGFGVRAVATQFSPDGRYLAVHYEQGQRHNYVWDLSRREPILKVSQDTFQSYVAFSPDSRLAALPRPDASICIYELPSVATYKNLAPGLPGGKVYFHPNGQQLAVQNGRTVQLRDLNDGKEVARFKHQSGVACLAWRSDGKLFATGCYDSDIYLWETAHPDQPLRIVKGHLGAVVHLSFSHAGDLLWSDSWDSTSRLWDPTSGRQLFSRPWEQGYGHSFTPDDQRLGGGWQVAAGRECRSFHGPKALLWVAIHPGGRLMATAATTGGVRLWDLAATHEGDKELAILPVGSCARVCFDPKDGSLLTDGSVGIQRWPITQDPQTGSLRVGPPKILNLYDPDRLDNPDYDPQFALSDNGRVIAHSPWRGEVSLIDLDNPARKFVLERRRMRDPAFSPDGRWLATGNWQGRGTSVWDVQNGKLAHELDLNEPEQDSAAWTAFSPDGKWLVTGIYAEYRFWEVGSWQQKRVIPRDNAGKSRGWIVFSPDGKMVALLNGVTEVQLLDPDTGREFARLPAAATPFCFSPDGSQLVTDAGRDGTFQVWDLREIRRQLAERDLDWNLPPYSPASDATMPLRVQVDLGEAAKPLTAEARARREIERYRLAIKTKPDNAYLCNALAWSYATAPEAQRDTKEALRLAEKAVRLKPYTATYVNTLGLAQYREGRYQQAVDTLLPNLKASDDQYLGWDLYVLAMAHHQLGQTALARTYFAWAVRWVSDHKKLSPDYAEELRAFHAEVEALLKPQ